MASLKSFESPPTNGDTRPHMNLIPVILPEQISNNNMRPVLLIYERVRNPLPKSKNTEIEGTLLQDSSKTSVELDVVKQSEKNEAESEEARKAAEASAARYKQIKKRVTDKGYEVIEVKKDGNCFFTSIVESLKSNIIKSKFFIFYKNNTTQNLAEKLRKDAISTLRDNNDNKYSNTFNTISNAPVINKDRKYKDFENYVSIMGNEGEYIDYHEIVQATADYLQTQIIIIGLTDHKYPEKKDYLYVDNDSIYIVYDEINHYDGILKRNTPNGNDEITLETDNFKINYESKFKNYKLQNMFRNFNDFIDILRHNENGSGSLIAKINDNNIIFKNFLTHITNPKLMYKQSYKLIIDNDNTKQPVEDYFNNLQNDNNPITQPIFIFKIFASFYEINIKYFEDISIVASSFLFNKELNKKATVIVHDSNNKNFYERIEKPNTM